MSFLVRGRRGMAVIQHRMTYLGFFYQLISDNKDDINLILILEINKSISNACITKHPAFSNVRK